MHLETDSAVLGGTFRLMETNFPSSILSSIVPLMTLVILVMLVTLSPAALLSSAPPVRPITKALFARQLLIEFLSSLNSEFIKHRSSNFRTDRNITMQLYATHLILWHKLVARRLGCASQDVSAGPLLVRVRYQQDLPI